MEQPSVEAVPRHKGSAGQRAAAGTVGAQQVAESSDIERSQLHGATRQDRQLRVEEERSLALARCFKDETPAGDSDPVRDGQRLLPDFNR